MSVPVSDPLWRRPALLASALAGLLVGLAAYGVRWTREQVQAYEPSVATAAAVAEPHVETPASPLLTEPVHSSHRVEVPSPADPPVVPQVVPEKAASPKDAAKRAARAKRTPPPRGAKAKEASAPVAAAVVSEVPKAETTTEAPPPPSTATEASSQAGPAGDAQAKSEPSSTAAQPEALGPFDRDAAVAALAAAAKTAERCRSEEGPFGLVRIAVTFAPNGRATTAVVEGPPFAGTPVGSCIARAFREARVSPFTGAPVTVRKSVSIF